MSFPVYPMLLSSMTADGAALNTSTTRTSILHDTGKAVIPAGCLQVGSTIRVVARGRISTFTSGTLTLDVSFAGTTVTSLGAITMVVSQTNVTVNIDVLLTVRALGPSGTASMMSTATTAGACFTNGNQMMPTTAPAVVSTGFDTAVANKVDLNATWSVSNAANSIQIHQCYMELKV